MSITITHKHTGASLFVSPNSTTIVDAVKDAIKSGAYLSGANLRGADLIGAYLSGAYLSGAYLSGANLRGANLRGANLRDAKLGDQWIIQGATRSDGYPFFLQKLTGDKVPMVKAGCRYLSLEDAQKH